MRLQFPFKGVNRGDAASDLPDLTTYKLVNVRPRDSLGNRLRGGQRPGLTKWGDGDQVGAAEQPVVAMCVVATVR